MDYQNTFNNLMGDINNITPTNITEDAMKKETVATVYEDFRLTVTNEMFTNAGLNEQQRIFVYVSNTKNVIYLSSRNSIGEDFGISKILKHTPNKGLRLNVGRVLNIGEVPSEMKIEIENGMIKIYPTNGLERLPANKAFEKVSETIQEVYGFSVHEFLNRIENGVI